MKKAMTMAVGILVMLAGWCAAQAPKPDPLDTIFEDRPLRGWLEDQLSVDREKAGEVLRRFCAKPEKAMPILAAALADKDNAIREAAVFCLGSYFQKKKDVQAAIPLLLKVLREDKSSAVRTQAADSLAPFGSEDKVVLAALLKALKEDESEDVRLMVADKLLFYRSSLKSSDVLPALMAAMKDKEVRVRCCAALTLGTVGDSKTVIPLLIDHLSDDESPKPRVGASFTVGPFVCDCAATALGERCPEAIPALCKALKDKNDNVRSEALCALGNTQESVWPILRKEVPAILPLLEDKDEDIRRLAAKVLGHVKALDAVPALAARLDDEDSSVRLQCMEALGQIGPDAAAAVEKLTNRLKDSKPRLRRAAAEALGHIGPKGKAAVPALIEALKDKDKSVRLAAIDALGDMGPDAKAAVPTLMDALNCDDKELIRIVEKALKKIGTE